MPSTYLQVQWKCSIYSSIAFVGSIKLCSGHSSITPPKKLCTKVINISENALPHHDQNIHPALINVHIYWVLKTWNYTILSLSENDSSSPTPFLPFIWYSSWTGLFYLAIFSLHSTIQFYYGAANALTALLESSSQVLLWILRPISMSFHFSTLALKLLSSSWTSYRVSTDLKLLNSDSVFKQFLGLSWIGMRAPVICETFCNSRSFRPYSHSRCSLYTRTPSYFILQPNTSLD